MTDRLPLHEREETQLVLYISSCHLPECHCFRDDAVAGGDMRYADDDTAGLVIVVVDPDEHRVTDWLEPIMRYAYDNCYSLIWFTPLADRVDYLPAYP